MKKLIALLVVLILALSTVFAYQNTYNAESSEYKTLQMLIKLSGKTAVSMVSPISAEQILIILNEIEPSKLDDTAIVYYNNLKKNLEHPEVNIKLSEDAGINGKLEVSYQFIKQAENETDWFLAKKDRLPMLLLGADIHFKDFLFAVCDIDFTDVNNGYNTDENKNAKITNNIVKSFDWGESFDWSMPHTAFLSAGLNGTNVIVGRDKLSLGSGKTGNLSLSDNLWYNDFVKASVVSRKLSYDCTAIYFSDSKGETEAEHNENPLSIEYNGRYEMDKDYNQFVVIHNISYAPADFISFSINEGALIYRHSLFSDFRNINPFFILHNVFGYLAEKGHNAGNMNNFFGGEINVSLPKGFSVSMQGVADQIQLSGETGDLPQPAFGTLINVTKAFTAFDGIGEAYIEGAYASPNLYLKEREVANGKYWQLDLIVGNKYVEAASGLDEVSYLGYKYGPSTIAVGLGCDWFNNKGFAVDFDTSMVMHGDQGIKFYEGQNDSTIAYSKESGIAFEQIKLISGDVTEYKFSTGLKVSYSPYDYLTLTCAANLLSVINYRNQEGVPFSDFQFAIGATIHGLEFIKNSYVL